MKYVRLFACAMVAALLAPGTAQALIADGGPALAKQARSKAREASRASERFIWPAKGGITTHFDGGHAGLDIDGEHGDELIATRSGRVTFAGDDGDGYGVKVLIKHPGGFVSLYSHLSKIVAKPGPIEQGDVVGYMGCTGSCTGDHLHFEIQKNGSATNPLDYLP